MSDPSSEPQGKPARPLNRWGLGTLSVLQIVLLAIILVALNYLTAHHFTRVDLSREAAYTLSPSTKNYLNDKVDAREVSNYDVRRIEVDAAELHRFADID